MTKLKNKRVLITGAASGLGKLMAERMGAKNARLILWDFNERALKETRQALESQGVDTHTYLVDLTDRKEIKRAAAQVEKDLGGIDVLINNAGIVTGKGLLEASEEDIQRTFDVNSLALFWTSRAFLPGMIDRNSGHIVTIASLAGMSGVPKLVDYCASKFAAFGFDEALRLEIRRRGYKIRTTVVCPYFIDTGMFDGVTTRFPRLFPILQPDYVVNKIIAAIQGNKPRLVMPRLAAIVWPARMLPVKLYDNLLDFLGLSVSMDEFKGRAASRASEDMSD